MYVALFDFFKVFQTKKKLSCHEQESNLRYPDHNRMYYHYTIAARVHEEDRSFDRNIVPLIWRFSEDIEQKNKNSSWKSNLNVFGVYLEEKNGEISQCEWIVFIIIPRTEVLSDWLLMDIQPTPVAVRASRWRHLSWLKKRILSVLTMRVH